VLEQERLPFVVLERDRPRFDAMRGADCGNPRRCDPPALLDAAGISAPAC